MDKHNDHPLFCYLNSFESDIVKPAVHSKTYAAHERLINIGDRGRDIICLLEGSVSVQVEDIEGNIKEIVRIHSGNLVGDMNFVIPTHRTANVVALTEVEAELISFDELCTILKEHASIACKVFAGLSMQLVDKYRRMM